VSVGGADFGAEGRSSYSRIAQSLIGASMIHAGIIAKSWLTSDCFELAGDRSEAEGRSSDRPSLITKAQNVIDCIDAVGTA